MIRGRRSLLVMAAFVAVAGCQTLVHADPVVLSLQDNIFSIHPGESVTLVASAFNSGATSPDAEVIDAIGYTIFQGFWHVDIGPFNTNFLFHTLTNGTTLGPLALITFTDPVCPTTIGLPCNGPGTYDGSVSIFYEPPRGGFEVQSNLVHFTITIVDPVPEPTTMLLLGTGLVGIAAKIRRRKDRGTVHL